MTNLTISLDENLVKQARIKAIQEGTSLSAKVRELLRFIDRSRDSGFLWPDVQELLLVDTDAERLLDRLAAETARLKAQTPPDEATEAPGGVSDQI